MNLLETIAEHITAQPLPLFAITVAGVPCPHTPVNVTLHWHGFAEEKLIELEEPEPVAFTPIPSLALPVTHRLSDLTTLDRAAMEAGWELGAWDVARAERAGCARPGEALECLQALGSLPCVLNVVQVSITELPDIDDLVSLATRRGCLSWLFRQVHCGIWAQTSNDATLPADGTRVPPCLLEPIPPSGSGRGKTVFCVGTPKATLLAN
ncbi:MAG: hypothetical protein ABI648_00130 [Betaproteobacteria bacterium]|jgi:hypothetical protein